MAHQCNMKHCHCHSRYVCVQEAT